MKQLKWFEREFSQLADPRLLPSLLERLAGTPARLEEKLAAMPPEWLTARVDGTWTIQENAGHLGDLEPLWLGRLEDIAAGKAELRPTDLTNEATTRANHNATALPALLGSFRQQRMRTVQRLQALDEAVLSRSGLHPRMRTPMRPTDLFLFVAEHDDHHLARISELARQLGGSHSVGIASPLTPASHS
ncbi:DinB family protein [Hymenobacter sp. BT523]|uniref:DinB family protein n=1 Tax=Hymenobacter sp. BT523 TaxID=2795725 RepID=UPI0018EBA4CC|nr:DinB family protein [Hymenobacter sp. BT523]MBJ6110328.1 DinB family protein [Hymenobacter sp. BT523]